MREMDKMMVAIAMAAAFIPDAKAAVGLMNCVECKRNCVQQGNYKTKSTISKNWPPSKHSNNQDFL